MIPKIIHYCWFGKNPKTPLALFCISSWKKMCRDYEVVEWNEDNFDVSKHPYTAEAYKAKKWAFVTDFVRLWVLYYYGGVYMDTDVQVTKPLDRFLQNKGFSGFESSGYVPTGIMASESKLPLIGELLNEYQGKHFILKDGGYNFETNTVSITRYLLKCGLKRDNTKQTIKDFTFYPTRFFCPKSWRTKKFEISDDTAAIHHFSGSWVAKDQKTKKIDDGFLNFFMRYPPKKAMRKCNLVTAPYRMLAFLKRLTPRRIFLGMKRRIMDRIK